MRTQIQSQRKPFRSLFLAFHQYFCRPLSTSTRRPSNHSLTTNNARWLAEIKARIGKCVMLGMSVEQTKMAGSVLKAVGEEWRHLVAGQEGFLVGRKRAGLLRQNVVWGEMDRMVRQLVSIPWNESLLFLKRGSARCANPMTWPDHISVFHKLSHLPSATDFSFVLDVMIISELHQRPAARCVEDIVVYDYQKGKKTMIKPFMMEAFAQTWAEQQAETARVGNRIKELDSIVREIEQNTWDREDAVEDMGQGR
ncbi:hypothetical protein BUE80_DR004688 [Diplocarpon rosae]|nr:hypothetical protein BUE80_DR004688 [Diplocarpon rosae]